MGFNFKTCFSLILGICLLCSVPLCSGRPKTNQDSVFLIGWFDQYSNKQPASFDNGTRIKIGSMDTGKPCGGSSGPFLLGELKDSEWYQTGQEELYSKWANEYFGKFCKSKTCYYDDKKKDLICGVAAG